MPTTCEEIKTVAPKPLLLTRISPIALGITAPMLYGKKPTTQAAIIRQASRNLAAIANELDGGVA